MSELKDLEKCKIIRRQISSQEDSLSKTEKLYGRNKWIRWIRGELGWVLGGEYI